MTIPVSPPPVAFTEADLAVAYEKYGLNCGPCALAAVLGITLDEVRSLIPGFAGRRHMNTTDMLSAIGRSGRRFRTMWGRWPDSGLPAHGLARVQWGGPWTAPGANPRWASIHTHWIGSTWHGDRLWVFDVNSGWVTFDQWTSQYVPFLSGAIDRADGTWSPTNRWEVSRD